MDSDLEVLLKAMLNEVYAESVDGDVESPTGYFGIVLVPASGDSFRLQLEQEFFDEEPAPMESGYYFVSLNSDGVLRYDGPHQDSEPARLMFEEAEYRYARWCTPLDGDQEL